MFVSHSCHGEALFIQVFILCKRNANKVRIIALYIQYRDGVPDEDRRRLYQHARLSLAEQDAVNALAYLGVRVSRVMHFQTLPSGYALD